ncbi:MAG: hypothetical protein ACOY5W_17060 [Pseudomonadota bacterium]
MNILVFLLLVIAAVLIVSSFRKQRDRQLLGAEVRTRGGELLRLERVRKGSPFPDTTRGWWAWRVTWRDASGERTSWALTTREGLGEWRD